MKTNAKIRLAVSLLILFVSLFAMNPSVYATEKAVYDESRKRKEGTYARYQEDVDPDFGNADDFHFIAWQAEQNVYINDWKVTIKGEEDWPYNYYCDGVEGELLDAHHLSVTAQPCDIWMQYNITMIVEFWLKPKWNTVHIKDKTWTFQGQSRPDDQPDHGWSVTSSASPSQKIVTIYNDEPAVGDTFQITNFEYDIATAYYYDLKEVPFGGTITTKFLLIPGDSIGFSIPTQVEYGHLYFHYTMLDLSDSVISELYGDHGMGGAGTPLPTLTEWGLIVLALLLAVGGVVSLIRKRAVARTA